MQQHNYVVRDFILIYTFFCTDNTYGVFQDQEIHNNLGR